MKFPHWHYFLSLVEDVDRLSRFVELAEDNFATFSVECTRILLAASSEVDVVARVLCAKVKPNESPRDICDHGDILLPAFPNLPSVEISIRRCGVKLIPWAHWTQTQRPSWWQSYNSVKHYRHTHASEGNLGNALNAVAGLCVLVCYLHFNDFVYKGFPANRPFLFLDRKYETGGKPLFGMQLKLPDMVPQPTP
jgi:hypothetical protein